MVVGGRGFETRELEGAPGCVSLSSIPDKHGFDGVVGIERKKGGKSSEVQNMGNSRTALHCSRLPFSEKFWPPFAASCFPKPWSSPPVVWLWRKESSHTSGVSLDGGDWGGALTEVEVESRPLGKSSPTTLTCDSRSVSTTTSCCAPSSRRPATCISVEVAASRRTCLGQHTQSKARSVHLGRHVR